MKEGGEPELWIRRYASEGKILTCIVRLFRSDGEILVNGRDD